ncbi:extracellular solute-binding protein [Nitriliruptoraceae bacterium ZYF776]|nr:extracellular solute-binding protein [Profundirhabdus halotolerans]
MRRPLCAAVVAALLAGCAASEPPAEPRVLRVVMADDWASAPAFRDVVATFEADHDDVEVRVEAVPFSQIPDLVRNAADLDDPYDLAHWHAFSAAAGGFAEPLDEQWERAGLLPEEYLPGAVEDVTWEGRRYGVPLDVNALVLLVNRAQLAAAGVEHDALTDAEGFLEVARTIVDSGAAERAITSSVSTWAAYGWIRAFGGDVLTTGPEGETVFTFDDPATVAAIDLLGQLAGQELATPLHSPDQAIDAVQLFTGGTAAIHPTGSWDLAVAGRASEVTDEDVDAVPLPRGHGDTGTVLGGSSLFVPEGSEHADLAFDLALALTEDEVAMTFAEQEGRLPARRRVYEDPAASFTERPAMATVVAELEEADVLPLYAYPDLLEDFRNALELVLRGQQDAATAMRQVQERAEGSASR